MFFERGLLCLGALVLAWAEDSHSQPVDIELGDDGTPARLVEAAGDGNKPLPDEILKKSLKKGLVTEDPEVKALEKQYYNLTDMVKTQASVVAKQSTIISEHAQESNTEKDDLKRLGVAYGQAHALAENATRSYKAHLAELAAAKQRRDELKNKTDEARKCLEEVGPQYQAAEYHYNILLSRSPLLEGIAANTSEDETHKGKDLISAGQHADSAKAKVQADDAALEAALAKLNVLNAELTKIQDKLNSQGAERGGALGPSLSKLLLIAGLSALA